MNPVRIMGMDVYPYLDFKSLIEDAVKTKKMLLSVNAEILCRADANIRDIYNSNIGFADGIGAVMALKKKGINNAIKLPGCEVWLKIVEKYYNTHKFYLIGSTEEVINETVSKLKSNYPNINIVGYRNGFISSESEEQQLLLDIEKTKPDFIFVAMGQPKQENLMVKMDKIHHAVYMGIGGSFDVFTGKVKRAPKWWIEHNLEWAYRLFLQPKRIKRQLILVKFMALVKLGKL